MGDFKNPIYSAMCTIESLEINMKKNQFDSLMEIIKLLEQYQKMQFEL